MGESIERHDVIRDEFDGICFYRVTKKVGILERGSIVTQRASSLIFHALPEYCISENGICKAYTKPFYIEEKVDGYNVRVASIQGVY